MAALVVAERIGIMSAEGLKHLLSITQMYLGDATRTRLAVGDHGVSIGVQVVMGVGPARCGVISFGIACPIR